MSKKEKTLILRLNEQQLKAAQDAAAIKTGGNVSEYIRLLILSENDGTNPAVQKELHAVRMEINKIGVNINQIAKNNNSGLYLERDKASLYESLNDIYSIFEKMVEEVKK